MGICSALAALAAGATPSRDKRARMAIFLMKDGIGRIVDTMVQFLYFSQNYIFLSSPANNHLRNKTFSEKIPLVFPGFALRVLDTRGLPQAAVRDVIDFMP